MNAIKAICGHMAPAVGAPYSQARFKAERSPCVECSTMIHCDQHATFDADCHWCGVAKEAFLRMTDAEWKAHGFRSSGVN